MKPDEMKDLAQLMQKVPGVRGIDFKDVKRLVELLQQSPEIGSIELKGWFGTGVVLTRTGAWFPYAGPPALTAHPVPAPAPASAAGPDSGRGAGTGSPGASSLKEIKSPMVGTFYASPEPGAE